MQEIRMSLKKEILQVTCCLLDFAQKAAFYENVQSVTFSLSYISVFTVICSLESLELEEDKSLVSS